jgi:hypothetical protein
MKFIKANPLLLLVLATNLVGAPKRNTVDFYLTDPNQYLGGTVSLSVSHVEPVAYRGNLPNLVFYRVFTDGENGMRSLPLAVNSSSAKNFADEYGTKTATQPKDYRNLSGKFRYVDPGIERKALSSGLWYVGIVPGAYFIDATTEGQLDEVFDWYPEKTAAVTSGKNIERASAKEATESAAVSAAKKIVEDAEARSGKKAVVVKQDVIPSRDKKICILEYFLE